MQVITPFYLSFISFYAGLSAVISVLASLWQSNVLRKLKITNFINIHYITYFLCFVCQKLEAQEREEQSLGKAIKLVKGKVGKPKVKKMNLEETMPSPFGRRVEPPTQALKSDAAKKLTKKKKVTTPDVILK